MSWWRKLFGRSTPEYPYGLHPDNPVLCGGGVEAELDYLQRLHCPAGTRIGFQRLGSLERTRMDYLNRPDVDLRVSRGTLRRFGHAGFLGPDGRLSETSLQRLPLDAYSIVCECGEHEEQIFIDMYFRGPELAIAVEGWTLSEGVSPAETLNQTAPCPYCGADLWTPRAQQCRTCFMDWHDPNNVYRRERKAK